MATFPAPSSVAASATSVQLAAASVYRKGLWIKNNSAATLYIAVGATPTSSSFHIVLEPYDFFEFPTHAVPSAAVNGIWDSATGAALVTDIS